MDLVMSDVVTFSKALGDATRWRILHLVMDEALCMCELADILGMPQSSVSSHVQVIRRTGMLESESCGKWTYFRVLPRYRKLLRDIGKSFPFPDGSQLESDAAKASRRLSVRETSCCPAPRRLVFRRKPTGPS
jgi:ArsR family transcriptional regulator, arsenate/arsenite/antimonite-responsive transcriptional repressor